MSTNYSRQPRIIFDSFLILTNYDVETTQVSRQHKSTQGSRQHMSTHVSRQHMSTHISRQHTSTHVLGKQMSTHVSRQHTSTHVSRQHTSTHVSRQHTSPKWHSVRRMACLHSRLRPDFLIRISSYEFSEVSL